MKAVIKLAFIIFIIATISIVAGVSIALALNSRISEQKVNMTTLEVTGIKAEVVSSSKGSKHNVSMNVYLEVSNDLASALGVKTLRKQLSDIVSKMDYDKLKETDNIQYVKDYITSYYSDDIDKREIGELYVTEIVTGPFKFFSAEAEEPEPEIQMDIRRQQRFDQLFQNTN